MLRYWLLVFFCISPITCNRCHQCLSQSPRYAAISAARFLQLLLLVATNVRANPLVMLRYWLLVLALAVVPGPLDPWTSGPPLDLWTPGPLTPGPLGPLDPWTPGAAHAAQAAQPRQPSPGSPAQAAQAGSPSSPGSPVQQQQQHHHHQAGSPGSFFLLLSAAFCCCFLLLFCYHYPWPGGMREAIKSAHPKGRGVLDSSSDFFRYMQISNHRQTPAWSAGPYHRLPSLTIAYHPLRPASFLPPF